MTKAVKSKPRKPVDLEGHGWNECRARTAAGGWKHVDVRWDSFVNGNDIRKVIKWLEQAAEWWDAP